MRDASSAWNAPGRSGPPHLRLPEFRLFQALLLREAGVHLADSKQAMVAGRLMRRLKTLGLRSYHEYYRRATSGDQRELCHLLDALTTHETRFFREPAHFEFLTQRGLPELLGRRRSRLRAWSAACSTGEEPYTLAMVLASEVPRESGVDLELLASDISNRVLEHARRGVYPIERAVDIPPALLKRFMLRGVGGQIGKMRVTPELRTLVRFEPFNLNTPDWPPSPPFDLIFCRNVLIYFDGPTRARVVERLLDRLAPDGYLFLGHAESLAGVERQVRCVQPTIYQVQKRSASA